MECCLSDQYFFIPNNILTTKRIPHIITPPLGFRGQYDTNEITILSTKTNTDIQQMIDNLKLGLSGILRVRNEATFLSACIDSVINSLDELIIVYNDCTDNSPQIIEQKRKEYPDKIKVFPYSYHILSSNLTKEEYEEALALPYDSPHLLCNYYNFALSKVSFKFAVKIDADQLYFEEEIKRWRDACVNRNIKWKFSYLLGWCFMNYFSLYRRISAKYKKPLISLLPNCITNIFQKHYLNFAKWQLSRGKVAVALSGFNVFNDNNWYIPFDRYNIHPPYNGEGDHVIFKVSNDTYYSRYSSHKKPYCVIEQFHCPYKMMFAGPVWFHLHANRAYCEDKVKKVHGEYPELFIPIDKFNELSYKQVLGLMDPKVNTLYQRTLFSLIHEFGKGKIQKYRNLLSKTNW